MQYIINFSENIRNILLTILVLVIIFYVIVIGNKYVGDKKALKISRKQLVKMTIAILFILVITKIYLSVPIVKELIFAIMLSITIAYILNPIANRLENRKVKRTVAIIIIYLVMSAFVVAIYYLIIPSMKNEVSNLVKDLPEYVKLINSKIQSLYDSADKLSKGTGNFSQILDDNLYAMQSILTKWIQGLTDNISEIVSKLVVLVLVPVITFYFLKDKEYFKKHLLLMCPKKYRDDLLKISRKMNIILGRFVRGQLILAGFIGVATAVGLFFIRVKFWLIIGLVAGIASIIPYFGPIIGIVPALFFALLDSTSKAAWVVILFVGIQQFEGDILSPRIVGDSVGLHPVVVMVILLIGGGIFGVIGMLLSVPGVVFLKIILNYVVEKLDEMGT